MKNYCSGKREAVWQCCSGQVTELGSEWDARGARGIKRARVRRQIARGSEVRRTGDGAACRRRDATESAKTRQAATGGIPTEPDDGVFALGWRIYAGCNGAESALPASRATEAPVQAWHVSVPLRDAPSGKCRSAKRTHPK